MLATAANAGTPVDAGTEPALHRHRHQTTSLKLSPFGFETTYFSLPPCLKRLFAAVFALKEFSFKQKIKWVAYRPVWPVLPCGLQS